MPKVPTYDAFQQQANALPGVRQTSSASPALMGGLAADQQQRMGGAVFKAAAEAQHEADQVRINDAMNKAVEAKLKLTYDPQDGFTHQRGESALNRPDGKPLDEEYSAKLGEHLAGIEAGLGNDAQKAAFRQQAGQMMVQFKGGLQQHVAKEFTEYNISVQDGTIKTAQQQMGLAWEDPDALAQSRDAIKAATYEAGLLRGWSAQQVEAATVEQLSRGHVSVLASAVDGHKLDYAREYLKQHTAELSPDARLSAQKALDAGDFEARTQDAADKLYTDHKGDISTALGEVRTKYSGKEEDAIITRLKGLDAERVGLRERAQKDAGDQAWRTYAQTGSLGKIPPSIIAAMDGKDVEALRRTARVDADAAQAKKEVKTDPSIYYALSMASATDPSFVKQDLRGFFDKLAPADRKHFMDLQAHALKPEDASQVVAVGEQKSAMVKALGLKDEQAGLFHQVADKALFAAQQEKGGKLNQDERQKVLDKLVLQGEVITGKWYQNDPNVRLFEAVGSGQADKFKATYSDADRNKATAALQRRGIKNPTQQQIDATLRAAYGIK